MIPLVRPPIEGELWWSVLARQAGHLHFNAPLIRHRMLVGNLRSIGSPLFPRQIDRMLKEVDLAIDAAEVIDRHTVFPYYASFLTAKVAAKARRCMATSGQAELGLGLAQMEDYPVALKRCPECVALDIKNHGEAAWRSVHQAPGVLLCVHDNCPLEITNVNARGADQIAHFTTAAEAICVRTILVPRYCQSDAQWLAACGRTLFEAKCPPAGQARLASLYRQQLRSQGFIDAFDRIRPKDFVRAFVERFGGLLPLTGCCRPDAHEWSNWLARLVREPRAVQSPLKHLLLMRFLGLEVSAALRAACLLDPCTSRTSAKVPDQRRSRRITEDKALARRTRWISLRAKGQTGSLREREDTLYCWLWRNDRAWLRRHAKAPRSHQS